MGKAKYKFKVVCTKLPEGVWSFSSGIGRDWRHISVLFICEVDNRNWLVL